MRAGVQSIAWLLPGHEALSYVTFNKLFPLKHLRRLKATRLQKPHYRALCKCEGLQGGIIPRIKVGFPAPTGKMQALKDNARCDAPLSIVRAEGGGVKRGALRPHPMAEEFTPPPRNPSRALGLKLVRAGSICILMSSVSLPSAAWGSSEDVCARGRWRGCGGLALWSGSFRPLTRSGAALLKHPPTRPRQRHLERKLINVRVRCHPEARPHRPRWGTGPSLFTQSAVLLLGRPAPWRKIAQELRTALLISL